MTAFDIPADLDPIEYARKAGEMARAQVPNIESQEPATLPQLTRDDLLEMSPAEINEAHANGQFSQMLGLI
ncbi:hypothetical protein E0L36_11325 [Streptomyces sp. AJS327]|uniref:hypothetical protein n=1 Tax=Streptomyces sp. AJS327 TaxID=2545265 RepID=UPI0015DFAB17|nr:hypothetical protein [Streptomyces sp. AJS327]MBA0051461.1 hypothetical protein [Streptomyces sp. AJS327]